MSEINCELVEGCKQSNRNKKNTLKDKRAKSKSKCLVENNREIEYNVIEFENCVYRNMQSASKKCDFGVETDDSIFFIELKGSDNNTGLKQLLSTAKQTQKCFYTIDDKNEKHVQKELHGILVVSEKQKPENLDKITLRDLALLIRKKPIIVQDTFTINI